jgi:hypothetical protein
MDDETPQSKAEHFRGVAETSGTKLQANCDTTSAAGISSWPWLPGSSGSRIVLRLRLLLLTSAPLSPSSNSRVVLHRRLDRRSGLLWTGIQP